MKTTLLAAAALAIVSSLVAATTEQSEAIKNFAYQGVTFGADVQAFRSKFPAAQFATERSDPNNGMHVFSLEGVSGVDTIDFWFFDKKLYQITYYYLPETVNKLGGWNVIAGKIVEKFGKADADSKGEDIPDPKEVANYFWRFPDVNRYIELRVRTQIMKVEFTDMDGYDKFGERKKQNANVGF